MSQSIPSHLGSRGSLRRRLALVVTSACATFLVPWVIYLETSLSDRYVVQHWRTAWVGFDIALIVAVAMTALFAWLRRQLYIPWAVVTGTLLTCDAWFDIALEWGTPDQTASLLTAVLGELPLAALLFYTARRLIRLTTAVARGRAGIAEPLPPLFRVPLLLLDEPTGRPATPKDSRRH